MTDTWTVIATCRARGLSDATIARKLGLRDGATGYGLTRQDNAPSVVVPAPKPKLPPAPEPPPRIRGRNTKYGTPDPALAEQIKTAGAICNDRYCGNPRDRQLNRQSTAFLIYERARIGLNGVASLYGYADHTTIRHQVRAVRDRLARDLTVDEERQRQARIMAVAGTCAR